MAEDAKEYINNAFEIERDKYLLDMKKHNIRVWLECAILLVAIFAVYGWMAERDLAAKAEQDAQNAKQASKKPLQLTCLFKQNGIIFEYPNCTAINEKYATLNY